MSELTAEILREFLHYDPESGVFRWKKKPNNYVKVGCETKNMNDWGYKRIQLLGKPYYAHRLAWLYVYGRWPQGQIDHVNRIKTDNRIANLREASPSENCQNRYGYGKTPGATYRARTGKWEAQITVRGKRISLGSYQSAELASAAYWEAKARYNLS